MIPKLKPLKKYIIVLLLAGMIITANFSFSPAGNSAKNNIYLEHYKSRVLAFRIEQQDLVHTVYADDLHSENGKRQVREKIAKARLKMKAADFWLRYLEPIVYHKVNGALPVEWETEVFEKFETPYRRAGAGLSLAELYLDEKDINADSLTSLLSAPVFATDTYLADSITRQLDSYHHFFLANRLFLLNLSAIYTTGFECPGQENIIPELAFMTAAVKQTYDAFDMSFPEHPLTKEYLELFDQAIRFINKQPVDHNRFDHFHFISEYVNPLFMMNQEMIRRYHVVSSNFIDYSLSDSSVSIFDKSLYAGQNIKGIFLPVDDRRVLGEIRETGRLLFYDPILSGNIKRSCASCHRPGQYLTDTGRATALQFDSLHLLPRNTPSLVNVVYNHLLMLDGRHTSLLNQAKDVVTNPVEMGGNADVILKHVMSCREYETAFRRYAKLTPNSKKVSLDHIVSAVILYYSSFSNAYSPFDDAMNERKIPAPDVIAGFNLFMGKAKCGTCHFVPQFNGVKPPYVSSEFEVPGVPADAAFTRLSPDSGRAAAHPVPEMMNAFRTPTIRNVSFTKPYMHNGVFNNLDEVISFYDAGGGAGKGLTVNNQTLSPDSLRLSNMEKQQLKEFMKSLNENINFDEPPLSLPQSSKKILNERKVRGEY